jgi:hypothetical protein
MVQKLQLDGLCGSVHRRGENQAIGRRDILIAWRGTIMGTEWAANVQIKLIPSGIDSRPSYNLTTAALRVEMGFLNLYTSKNSETRYNKTSARQQVNALLVYIHVDLAPI